MNMLSETDRYQELILENSGWLSKGATLTDKGGKIANNDSLIKSGNFNQDAYVQILTKVLVEMILKVGQNYSEVIQVEKNPIEWLTSLECLQIQWPYFSQQGNRFDYSI